jgi:hypothetical protein
MEIRIRDPRSGMEKIGSGINIPDLNSESLETGFWVKNTLIHGWGSGSGIRDPGWKKSDPGSGNNTAFL